MRYSVLALACVCVAAGCATQPRHHHAAAEESLADARPAAALVFEPALALNGPPPELSRDGRQPEAFVGYAEGVTEFFYLRWDDRQANWGSGHHGGDDRYERRAVSEKFGALYR